MVTSKYRVYPTHSQEVQLLRMLESMCEVYNWALQSRTEAHEAGTSLTRGEQSKDWTLKRQSEQKFQQYSAGAQQDVLKRVQLAMNGFFDRLAIAGKKAGYPRLKTSKRLKSVSFVSTKAGFSYIRANDLITQKKRESNHQHQTASMKLQGVKGEIKVREHRKCEGKIKTLTVSVTRGKWYVTIVTDHVQPSLPLTGKEIGLDLGKHVFIAQSDGVMIPAPRFLNETLPKLKEAQRILANAEGGTAEKRNAGERMSESAKRKSKRAGDLHEKVKNQRADFHKKQAYRLASEFDTVYVEDLNIQGMVDGDARFGPWAKKAENRNTYDAGLGMFINYLTNRAVNAGKLAPLVSPAYTSQRCNPCGYIDEDNREDEEFKCLDCGHEAHADVNASKNVQYRGSGGTFRDLDLSKL